MEKRTALRSTHCADRYKLRMFLYYIVESSLSKAKVRTNAVGFPQSPVVLNAMAPLSIGFDGTG